MYKFGTRIKVIHPKRAPLPELSATEKRRAIKGPHKYIKSNDKPMKSRIAD